MPSIGPSALHALEQAMRFRSARAGVLAGNVANADTPGYRRRDLSFDGVLSDERERMARTHRDHLPTRAADPAASARLELGPRGTRPDGNGVDLDQELVEVNRNAGAYSDQATVLARMSALVRVAIGQG